MMTFKSLTPQQTMARKPPPSKDNNINTNKGFIFINKGPNRIRPYPPNFNKIPARTIEPLTGAST